MRSISSAALASIQAVEGEERTFLIAFDFSGGTLRFSTGTRDILWSGQTWVAVGGALTLGAVEESEDLTGAGVDVTLGGVDQAVTATLLSEDYRGRTVQVWQALLDPVVGDVIDTIDLFDGLQLDNYEIKEVGDRGRPKTVTIRTRARHRLGVAEFRGIRANVHSHQRVSAGDLFFQHVASLSGRKIFWGTAAPATIHERTPGGRDDGGRDSEGPDR